MTYIDLDGVLADFRGWILSLDKGAYEIAEKHPMYILELMIFNHKRCFLDCDVIMKNMHILDEIEGPKRILTVIPVKAILRHFYNAPKEENGYQWNINKCFDIIRKLKRNKIAWCKEHLGISEENILFCNTRTEKLIYAVNNAVLYDDCEETVQKWEHEGCKGYLIK